MPGKRIKDLTALSGAGSANDDDVVIFDTTANETKRISRSQLAEGMQADVQVLTNKTIALGSNTVTGTTAQFNTALTDNNFATQAGAEALSNKTIDSANNTLTINYKEAQVETSNGSRTHLFTTVAALLADTGTYTTYTAGQYIRTSAEGFSYAVAATGATDHHVTTAGGVKLYVQAGDAGYNVKAFGAVGDGVADDTAEIQAALNSATASKKSVSMPSGTYKISNSLFIGSWNGSNWSGGGFAGASLIGEIYAYATALSAVIMPTFNDKPALIIQNARNVTVKNVSFIGTNTISTSILSNYTLMMDPANFVVGGARDSRYSPYAGICIDPFGTSTPADGGYPGLTGYYTTGAAGSSKVIIDNVQISDFVVGIMITPNQVTQNAEDLYFRAASIGPCKVGVAVGQSQSRTTLWHGGNTAFCYYGFDTKSYGRQQGVLPHIDGTNMSGKYLFNVGPNYGTPSAVQNIYAESFASIGSFYASATSQHTIAFVSCSFNFSDFFVGGASRAYADSVYSASAPTKFIGCTFENTLYNGPFRMYTTAPTNFDACVFRTKQSELPLWRSSGPYSLQFNDMTFNNCAVIDDSTRGSSTSVITDDMTAYYFTTVNRRYAPYGGRIRLHDTATNSRRIYWNANVPQSQSETTISATQAIVVGASGIATMTVPDGTVIRVGDAVISATAFTAEGTTLGSTYNPIGIVTSVVGNDVTFSGVPQNLGSGTYYIITAWWPRYHLASTGDVTSASDQILNVTNPTTWLVGNKINGTGLPVGVYVTGVSGTTVTISKAATATNAGVRLYDADLYYAAGTVL